MAKSLYNQTFTNSPVARAYLNDIGPEGLFALLESKPSLIARIEKNKLSNIRAKFIDFIRPQFGDGLDTATLHDAIMVAYREAGLADAFELEPTTDKSLRYSLLDLAGDIHLFDALFVTLANQIASGDVDYSRIRMEYKTSHEKAPGSIANKAVKYLAMGRDIVGTRIYDLLCFSVGRIAFKNCSTDDTWFHKQSKAQLEHIVDWLVSAVVNEAPWLLNVDTYGRPKKLMKFGSLDAMEDEADKDLRRRLSQQGSTLLDANDEEIFADNGGSFRIVRLKTTRALVMESRVMRHCIGHGAYDHYLRNEDSLLLSLRDKRNKACATIEVQDKWIVQIRGRSNHQPKDVYHEATVQLLEPLGIRMRKFEPLGNPCREFILREWPNPR